MCCECARILPYSEILWTNIRVYFTEEREGATGDDRSNVYGCCKRLVTLGHTHIKAHTKQNNNMPNPFTTFSLTGSYSPPNLCRLLCTFTFAHTKIPN